MLHTKTTSIIIVTYNSEPYIQQCLDSIFAHSDGAVQVIVVDNGSSDATVRLIEKHFPAVCLINAGENLGFAGGNNRGAQEASGEVLVFINPDTAVSKGWLSALTTPLIEEDNIGFTTPKILMMNRTDCINTAGNDVHFTGFGTLHGWMASADTHNEGRSVMSVSGAAFATRKSLYMQLGGFDEAFFPAYTEDTDLTWRGYLLGYSACYVPQSIVYHDYTLHFNPNKMYWLERNRYQMLLKVMRWPTLALLTPAFLLAEFITWGYALISGVKHLQAKLRSYAWVLANLGDILGRRRKVQATRQVSDRAILARCTSRMAFGQASEGAVATVASALLNPVFYVLHRVYLRVIQW